MRFAVAPAHLITKPADGAQAEATESSTTPWERPSCIDNGQLELVIDVQQLARALPAAIEAVFYMATSDETEQERARTVHRDLLRHNILIRDAQRCRLGQQRQQAAGPAAAGVVDHWCAAGEEN